MEEKLLKVSWASIYILALFTFTAFSLSAGHHILISMPAFYFAIKAIKNKSFKLPASSWFILGLIIISCISIFLNEVPSSLRKLSKLKYFLLGVLAIFPFRELYKNGFFTPKRVRLLINIFLISTTIASLSGLIGLFSGFNPLRFKAACHPERSCGMYGMYMSYAYGIQFVLTLLIGMLIKYKKIQEYVNLKILIIALVINFVGFYFSFARGAYLSMLLTLPMFFFKKNKLKFLIGLVFVSIMGFSAYKFIPKINETFSSPERMGSIGIRISQYKAAYYAFKESPWFGVGFRNFEPQTQAIKEKYDLDYKYFQGHGHSNFFEHLASTGILGLIFLLLFHFFWLFESYKRDDVMASIYFPFIASVFISGQFQYTLGDGENMFLIMPLYALFFSKSD